MSEPAANASLHAPEAGRRVIRGSALRGLGFGAGAFLAAASIALVARLLEPSDFGRFASIMALIGIVSGLSDAGLTIVGAREVAACHDHAERRRLLRNLLTMRLVLAPIAIAVGVAYAWLAGWSSTDIAGTAIVGLGLALINVQGAIMLPLTVDLRIGIVTAIEVLRQVVWLAFVAAVVIAGGGLSALFAGQVVVGLAALACLPWLRGTDIQLRPGWDRQTLWRLTAHSAPVAASVVVGVIYVRAVMLLTEQLTDPLQTGYFAASFRAFESLWMLPTLLLAGALPVLAVAGDGDRQRLAYALDLLTRTALVLGILIALVVGFAAAPIIRILAGPEYAGAAPVLQIQSIALIALFLGQAWQLGLLALRAQREILLANAAALLLIVPLALALIPAYGAKGSAGVALAGETTLALSMLLFLRRADRTVVPALNGFWRIVPPLAVAVAGGWLLRAHPLPAAAAAGAVFVGLALWARAIPAEIRTALPSLRRGASSAPRSD